MSGALMATQQDLLGGVDWQDIVSTVGTGQAQNNDQTMPFATVLGATYSPSLPAYAQLYYVKNGGSHVAYNQGQTFAVAQGDTIHWYAQFKSPGGTATINVYFNATTTPVILDRFDLIINP